MCFLLLYVTVGKGTIQIIILHTWQVIVLQTVKFKIKVSLCTPWWHMEDWRNSSSHSSDRNWVEETG